MSDDEQEARDHFFSGPLGMVQFCEDTALEALQFEEMAEPERNKLLYAKKHLRPAVEALINTMREIPNDLNKTLAQDHIRDSIFAAMLIGRYSDATESAKIFARWESQSIIASKSRPEAISPFTKFFIKKLKQNRFPAEIKDALLNEARSGAGGDFEMSEDQQAIIAVSKEENGIWRQECELKVVSISSAISKAKKKIQRPKFPTTG
jgi:hypothetical protein